MSEFDFTDFLLVKERANTLLTALESIIGFPSANTSSQEGEISDTTGESQSVSESAEESPNSIEVLQKQIDDLRIDVIINTKNSATQQDDISNMEKELGKINGQLASMAKLEQRVDDLARAIEKGYITGQVGLPKI